MNRRSFITDMLKAGVACTFLPGAGRIWKPTYQSIDIRFFVPKPMCLDLDELFRNMYAIKRARERMGYDPDYYYLAPINFAEISAPRAQPLISVSQKHDPLSFTPGPEVGVFFNS